MSLPLYINGRILNRDLGGVRRYAQEVSQRLDRVRVLRPPSAKQRWSGRVWEQTTLLRQSEDGVLLNMAHSGPARHPRQVNVIHDLFALQDPKSVHPAYAALMRLQIPRLAKNASRLVTVSAQVADELAETFAINRVGISVVPPGISSDFVPGDQHVARAAIGADLDRPAVAALLDATPRKNSPAVIQLLREIQRDDPTVQILVAGRPQPAAFARTRTPYRSNRSRQAVSRTGFLDLGHATDEALASMYRAADVFVSLTSGEGFGLPAVEAASCGAAVVTTAVPSITEHCPDAAITVGSSAEARQAIHQLLSSARQRSDLAAQARSGLGDLQWSKTAASLEDIMKSVDSP